MKIGIIKERKKRIDNRVALTPKQCMSLMAKFPDLEIFVEPSDIRCYTNDEYSESGVKLSEDMEQCDVLIGVKEVPVEYLIEGKTYFFFSHTIKKQPYNQVLLQNLVDKGIRMIDYECLVNDQGSRLLGFGFWAGVVGAHNGLLNYGKKSHTIEIPPAHSFKDYRELREYYEFLELPSIRIAVTGSGKVAQGILEFMGLIGAEKKENSDIKMSQNLTYGYFPIEKLYEDHDEKFDKEDFFENPTDYKCVFTRYKNDFDLLMNGIFWTEKIDRLFEKDDISKSEWSIQTIADISCDENGSVPINLASTSISDPSYGVDRKNFDRRSPYLDFEKTVDVMAVDNLPNELPRDASRTFGKSMVSDIIPELLKKDSNIIESGTICEDGHLTSRYSYLQDFYEA